MFGCEMDKEWDADMSLGISSCATVCRPSLRPSGTPPASDAGAVREMPEVVGLTEAPQYRPVLVLSSSYVPQSGQAV